METSKLAQKRFSLTNRLKGKNLFMMSGVNNSEDYIHTMRYGYVQPDGIPVVTNSTKQGGIVAVYYLGTLVGCLLGGVLGDSIGRIKTVVFGCIWSIIGAALQCSAQNAAWMICARLINGIGTGHLNVIVPVWASEVSNPSSRGAFIAQEFTLNIFGCLVAYWLEFGLSYIDGGRTQLRWRLPIAFQIFPLSILAAGVNLMPESPRWLIKAGRRADAEYILGRLRCDSDAARREADEIQAVVQLEHNTTLQTQDGKEKVGSGSGSSYLSMLLGRGRPGSHVARRVQLVVWLQILQEWLGTATVTVYAPRIFSGAGYTQNKSNLLAGFNNVTYMLSTLIAVFTIDKIGRRWTMYWGSVGQGISMFLVGGFTRLTFDATGTTKQSQYGAAAAFFTFLFTFIFGASWLVVPWVYPTEIFPLECRARGNAWSVVGWSIGNAWLTLLTPVMFEKINEKTLYIFGICNAISIPIVWAFYPETNQRTLEEMDLLFSSKSFFAWEAEKQFARLQVEHPEIIHQAHAGESNCEHANAIEQGSGGYPRKKTAENLEAA